MSAVFKAACVQVNAQREIEDNVARAIELIREARSAGADLITMPENVAMMGHRSRDIRGLAMPEAEHVALAAFRDAARDTGAWLLPGSLGISADDGRVHNRSYLIDSDGGIVARYDKIHMFDVDLPSGESYRESKNFKPGGDTVITPTPWGLLGLTVCYDVRFPHLYRTLAKAGARFITVPSAFTRTTGTAHWHVLLRSRAIETGCFVIAPAQCGTHPGERQTYGHSLIVNPWGEVLSDGGGNPGIVVAEIDCAKIDEARHMVPSLAHDQPLPEPEVAGQSSEAVRRAAV
ncbi:MAG: amidohydrolase [Alphaproteobacteria bacterium]|nr:amidohydrolase [Alphaproteobacteria bacterium]|tara:strand:+ start:116 stop:985 length:870 start_codon:yes stop_codon:yes gene_type:complete